MDYSPLAPEVKRNPYPYYAELRRDHPVYRIEPLGAYAVSRYDDVVQVLLHPDIFSSGYGETHIRDRPTTLLIFCDPPDHTRLRSLVNRAFTPKMVADLEPRIRQVTDELIARVAPNGELDLIEDLAMPLPVTMIAEILGVTPERRDDFKRWSDDVIIQIIGALTEEDRQRIERNMEEFQDYFEQAINERRREPRDDLISALVQAEEERQALTSDEVIAFTGLLLVAGNETTTNLIGNAVIALLEHPDQLARVLEDRSLIPNLVEEALRYDSPVQFLFRKAMRDVELAGTTIPKDAVLFPLYGSANRDERKFPDAERFDVTRDAQGHLAFGYGIHFCLGAPLARLEAKIALEALLFRLRGLSRKEEQVDLVDSLFLRGPKRLPLTFTPVPATAAISP